MSNKSLSSHTQTIIRIDDISVNLDPDRLEKFLALIRAANQDLTILLAVSPAVFDMPKRDTGNGAIAERVFPSILNAHSDHKVFYKIEKIGIPFWLDEMVEKYDCVLASHGLIHVDHRLLPMGAQEMSIVTSLSLIKSNIFVPPFNKYNKDTELVCEENEIDLIKWEDGWNHLGYQPFANDGRNYYVHLHDYPGEKLFTLLE
jgi:hypothetical protein